MCFDSDDICAETYLRAMRREELTNGAKTLASLAAPLELFGYIEFPISDLESVSYSFFRNSGEVLKAHLRTLSEISLCQFPSPGSPAQAKSDVVFVTVLVCAECSFCSAEASSGKKCDILGLSCTSFSFTLGRDVTFSAFDAGLLERVRKVINLYDDNHLTSLCLQDGCAPVKRPSIHCVKWECLSLGSGWFLML